MIIFCVAVALWTIWQYPKYLSAPFARYGQDRGLWQSEAEKQAEELAAMKEKDTDDDGLNDYDETYLYGTSLYLADSDSDGFSDKEEILSGNDPTCPAGKTCPKIADGAGKTAPTAEAPTDETSTDAGLGGFLAGTATADEVRSALRQAGVDDATLNKLDDKTLLELYNETLKEAGGGSQSATNTNSSLLANVNADNMTPEQLREILRQAGVDDATLKSVDDATLMKIFQETINKK